MKQAPKECVKEVIEVYENFEGVSKNFRGVLGKFHGCHREISRVFQECFMGDSSLFQPVPRRVSRGVSRGVQGSFIKVPRIFYRSFKDLS